MDLITQAAFKSTPKIQRVLDIGCGAGNNTFRSEDFDGVKDFARGCMRTYLQLKEKAEAWNADAEIREIVAEINAQDPAMDQYFGAYSADKAEALRAQSFDRDAIAKVGLKYERLDQLTIEVLLGVR